MNYLKNTIAKLADATGRTRLAPYIHRVILYSGDKFQSALEKQVYLQLLTASLSMKNLPSHEELGSLSGNENVEIISLAISNLIKRGVLTLIDKREDGRQVMIYKINDIFSI